MNCCFNNVTTNAEGIPFISSATTTVGTDSVDIALGFRRIQPIGYFTVNITDAIPTGTTTTLPITLTLNGTTRNLTLMGGAAVTVADLIGVTGAILVFNNRFNGTLQLMSRTTA